MQQPSKRMRELANTMFTYIDSEYSHWQPHLLREEVNTQFLEWKYIAQNVRTFSGLKGSPGVTSSAVKTRVSLSAPQLSNALASRFVKSPPAASSTYCNHRSGLQTAHSQIIYALFRRKTDGPSKLLVLLMNHATQHCSTDVLTSTMPS